MHHTSSDGSFVISILCSQLLYAVGLCLAGAVAYGYSNIFVTAPSPENLKTVFEFIISGLKALKYNEHLDFEVCMM